MWQTSSHPKISLDTKGHKLSVLLLFGTRSFFLNNDYLFSYCCLFYRRLACTIDKNLSCSFLSRACCKNLHASYFYITFDLKGAEFRSFSTSINIDEPASAKYHPWFGNCRNLVIWMYYKHIWRRGVLCEFFFIGPESDHWLCFSLTHWLLFSKLD